jgi:hypothetical protein
MFSLKMRPLCQLDFPRMESVEFLVRSDCYQTREMWRVEQNRHRQQWLEVIRMATFISSMIEHTVFSGQISQIVCHAGVEWAA